MCFEQHLIKKTCKVQKYGNLQATPKRKPELIDE